MISNLNGLLLKTEEIVRLKKKKFLILAADGAVMNMSEYVN